MISMGRGAAGLRCRERTGDHEADDDKDRRGRQRHGHCSPVSGDECCRPKSGSPASIGGRELPWLRRAERDSISQGLGDSVFRSTHQLLTSIVSSPALRIGARTARPRLSQDRTVPSGTPSSVATSATGMPSPSWRTERLTLWLRQVTERGDHRQPVSSESGHVLNRGQERCQPEVSSVVRREVPHDSPRPGGWVVVAADLSPVNPRSYERLLGEFVRNLQIAREGVPQPDQLRACRAEELVVVGPSRPTHIGPHTHIHTRTGRRAARSTKYFGSGATDRGAARSTGRS